MFVTVSTPDVIGAISKGIQWVSGGITTVFQLPPTVLPVLNPIAMRMVPPPVDVSVN